MNQKGYAMVFLLLVGLTLIMLGTTHPKDSTDRPDSRSGLTVYTDAKTGVQYLGTRHGLTPRLNADGSLVVSQGDE